MKNILDQFIQKPVQEKPKQQSTLETSSLFSRIIEEQDEQIMPKSRSSTRNQGPDGMPRIKNSSYCQATKSSMASVLELKAEKTESSDYRHKKSAPMKRAPSKK
jgi:hypothetical protein